MHSAILYLKQRFIIWGSAKIVYNQVQLFVSAAFVFVWSWSVSGSSHPRFQLSFHSEAGGTKQPEPLKCKFPRAVSEGWGKGTTSEDLLMCQPVLFVHMLITNTLTQCLLSQRGIMQLKRGMITNKTMIAPRFSWCSLHPFYVCCLRFKLQTM